MGRFKRYIYKATTGNSNHSISVSEPRAQTKYYLIESALKLGKEVLWIEGPRVILLQNPVPVFNYEPTSDLLITEEFYSELPRKSIFFARPGSLPVMELMAEWIRSNPYSVEERGWHFLIKSAQKKDDLEHMSFLPSRVDLDIKIGVLDSSTEFVGNEGYAGSIDHTVAYIIETTPKFEEDRDCIELFYLRSKRRVDTKYWYKKCVEQRFREINPKKAKSHDGEPPKIRRMVQISYAQGCCEKEQKQSAKSALQFGCDESRSLNASILSDAFLTKNQDLLKFDRRPFMQFKTPSNTMGYYVWKPYVLLKTLEDPLLTWNDSVVVYLDAGLTIIGHIRETITRALKSSDAVAFMTDMFEADWSKRDAFVLLDADVPSITTTHQIASCFIAVRKTELGIKFVKAWLEACETRRVISEEPSETELPNYPGFRNNNDDQTAFSITFKKFGFTRLSKEVMMTMVDPSRNLAKFTYALTRAALGGNLSSEAYNSFADNHAKRLDK